MLFVIDARSCKVFVRRFGVLVCLFALLGSSLTGATQGAPPNWTRPVKPFRIAGDIYYVGTEGLGAYSVAHDHNAVLIDVTTGENPPLIEKNIESLGFRLTVVKLLLESHAHFDHVGGLARIRTNG